jgi:hypothetical protein
VMRLVLDDLKQWSPRRLLIKFTGSRTSAKSIAELGISCERVGYIIHEDLDMRKLSAKWVPKCQTLIKNANGASHLSNFRNFFVWHDLNDFRSSRDWWPWTKPGYITMSRRQSNNRLSTDIAGHPAQPLKILNARNIPLEKFSPRFLGSWLHPPHWLYSRGPNYLHGVLFISAGAMEGHFDGKTPREVYLGCLVLARQAPGSPGTCKPEEIGLPGLPISWLPTLSPDLAPSDYHLFLGVKK